MTPYRHGQTSAGPVPWFRLWRRRNGPGYVGPVFQDGGEVLWWAYLFADFTEHSRWLLKLGKNGDRPHLAGHLYERGPCLVGRGPWLSTIIAQPCSQPRLPDWYLYLQVGTDPLPDLLSLREDS